MDDAKLLKLGLRGDTDGLFSLRSGSLVMDPECTGVEAFIRGCDFVSNKVSTMHGYHSIECSCCSQQYNVEYNGVAVTKRANEPAGRPRFCPYCGSDETKVEKEDNYWIQLSESLGFSRDAAGAELTRQLYNLWPTDQFTKFRDFVEHETQEEVTGNGTG